MALFTNRLKIIFGNSLLFLASTIIALLLAEIVLRQFVEIPATTSSEYRMPHPVFGWSLKPNASYINELPEKNVKVSYNSNGWRDKDKQHSLNDTTDTFRIAVLGDSFMEAYSVELQNSFARQLEDSMRQMGINTEVYNFGVGGYGTLQEFLVYQEVARRYNPDLVLLGMYLGNDLRNNSYALESMLNINENKVKNRPFLISSELPGWEISEIDYEENMRRYKDAENDLKSVMLDYARKSALVLMMKNVIDKLEHAVRRDSSYLKTQVEKSLALYGVHYCQEPPLYTESWNITEQILQKLNADVSEAGGTLAVFTVPGLFEVDKNRMAAVYQNMSDPDKLCLEEAPGYDRLSGITERLDINYINLLPTYRRKTQEQGMDLYNLSDRHWNKHGHQTAAKKVLSILNEKGLVP